MRLAVKGAAARCATVNATPGLKQKRRSAVSFTAIMVTGLLLTSMAASVAASGAFAQAASYPAFQPAQVSVRDYTAAISAGTGTAAFFQWREGLSNSMHFSLEAGLLDRKGNSNMRIFAGGSLGSMLMNATDEQPLDILLTGGFGLSMGNSTTIFRIPVGASVGHTFELEDGMSLSPFVHPRVSLDMCSRCGLRSSSELSLNFDVGVDFRVNRQLSLRAAAMFSGSDYLGNGDALGFGLNWTPPALR